MSEASESSVATSGDNLKNLMDEVTRRARIAPGAELGKAARKAQQKVALLQQSAAKSSFQDKLTIGNVAEAVGLTAIGFSGLQLHGAMLAVVEASRDPEKLVAYEVAGKAWFDSRRPARDPEMVRVGVTAAIVSAELAQACRDLRLRRIPFAGLVGQTTVSQALELGRLYSATVTVEHKGEELQLVNRGEVDATVLGTLTAETGMDRITALDADEAKDNTVGDADASVAVLTTSEAPAMAANTNNEDAATAEAEAAIPRPHHEPMRPLRRPVR